MAPASHEHDDLLTLAREIALTAGELAARRRREGVSVAASKSSSVDIVTEADRETEALIRGLLADARPTDGFFGEESAAEQGSSGLTWIVDPIDGTVNFLYGLPHYAVSIAVVEGEPDPQTWTALAGCVSLFVAQLASPYREAITLVELEGKTAKEAAEMVGLSVSGMKSRVQRGRAQLRDLFERCCEIAVDVRGKPTDFTPRVKPPCKSCT
ncbi:MAG: inositol monophosphatase family protein [Rhodoglobus sp.]